MVAIAQHSPTTMRRMRGVDFRVPTDEELDALAAFQLSLGRQEDFDLPGLELKSELASRGKTLFLDSGDAFEPGHKNCNACHFNGGGTTGFTLTATPFGLRIESRPRGINIGSPTNVNEIPLALTLGLPRDGGFGQIPTVFGSFGNTDDLPPPFGRFELEEFNTPPLVEAADTAPLFHNHAIDTVERAVAFYGSPAFKASLVPRLLPIDLSDDPNDPEVLAIGALLRVLNALENIRSSIDVAERGRTMTRVADLRDLARLSAAEAEDALQVLSGGALAATSEAGIRSARAKFELARLALGVAQRVPFPFAVHRLLGVALQQIREARTALANPATLPPSFRN
jgi:hypothetical protein